MAANGDGDSAKYGAYEEEPAETFDHIVSGHLSPSLWEASTLEPVKGEG
jgi:hypothetical protein